MRGKNIIAGKTLKSVQYWNQRSVFPAMSIQLPRWCQRQKFCREFAIGKMRVQAFHPFGSNARCVSPTDCHQVKPRTMQISTIRTSISHFGLASARRVAAKVVIAAWVSVAHQRAVRAAATLCWGMAGASLALAVAKLSMKAAVFSLHLHPDIDCKHHQLNRQRWLLEEFWVGSFFASVGILPCGSCEPSRSASRLAAGHLECAVTQGWCPPQAGFHSAKRSHWLWPRCNGHHVGGRGWYWRDWLWCLSWPKFGLPYRYEQLPFQWPRRATEDPWLGASRAVVRCEGQWP